MLIGISLKAYFGLEQTVHWVQGLAELVNSDAPAHEYVVFPSYTALSSVADALQNTSLNWGAQDVSELSHGAQTGDIPVNLLTELGCVYVEIGHAERRRFRGETDQLIAEKVHLAQNAGLTPFLCIGEPTREEFQDSLIFCVDQIDQDLSHCVPGADVVIAYEPVWAIGAAEPAPATHVIAMLDGIRQHLAARNIPARVIYGGAAGPGTLTALSGHTDGVFLGRFAHDLSNVAHILHEANSCDSPNSLERK